jgi:hypothetical protein
MAMYGRASVHGVYTGDVTTRAAAKADEVLDILLLMGD